MGYRLTPGGTIVFLRSCDLHAVRRLDAMFRSEPGDYYYERLREKVKFVVVGCREPFESCFCVDMGTSRPDGYDAALDFRDGVFYVDNKNPTWEGLFSQNGATVEDPRIPFVSETRTRVTVPEDLPPDVAGGGAYRKKNGQRIRFKNLHKIHDHKKRFGVHMCVGCGRCDDVCPEYISFSGSIDRLGDALREGGEAR